MKAYSVWCYVFMHSPTKHIHRYLLFVLSDNIIYILHEWAGHQLNKLSQMIKVFLIKVQTYIQNVNVIIY